MPRRQRLLDRDDKLGLIESHECGVPARELAAEYGISVGSVAAYVANAHRGRLYRKEGKRHGNIQGIAGRV